MLSSFAQTTLKTDKPRRFLLIAACIGWFLATIAMGAPWNKFGDADAETVFKSASTEGANVSVKMAAAFIVSNSVSPVRSLR